MTGNLAMPPHPCISIVTPCLNMGAFIEDAIRSVQGQDYPNFEHIIIDAGSRDNTLEILQRYPHLRWVSEPDRGQSDGLNKGFRMARGDLVGWLNADEYYLPSAFDTIAHAYRQKPETDVFFSDGIFVDQHARLCRARMAHCFDRRILLYYGCFIGTDNTFFKRAIFEEDWFIDIDYKVAMDYEYFVRLAIAGKLFHYVPALVSAFRWTGANNSSLQGLERRRERLQVQRSSSSRKLPDYGYDALANLFRLKRIALKVMNGNYRHELQIRTHAGKPTDWFRSEEGRTTCAILLETAHSSLRREQSHCRV